MHYAPPVSEPTISQLCDFAHVLADAARRETVPRFRTALTVDNKVRGGFDPVTEADREAERAIRSLIQVRFPDHGILGEEWGRVNEGASYRWVLDPVDGTRAFILGLPSWTTLIALERDGRPLLGLIDQPVVGERWVGTNDVVLYHSHASQRRPKTSGVTDLQVARLVTTDPRPEGYFSTADAQSFSRLAAQTAVCRFSLDAYGYAMLASGHVDLVVEAGLAHYDYAALAPVIHGAGGLITDWQGRPFDADRGGYTLAAATPALHEAAMAVLNQS